MNVVSVQTGRAEAHPGDPSKVSGIFKRPVEAIVAGYCGVDGDMVIDTRYHGGPDKAVCCYSAVGYDHWRAVYPDVEWGPGTFGENVTFAGFDEHGICLGDRLKVGEAVVQVSQPRGPCGKLAAKVGIRDFVKVCCDHGSTGWYLRVLQPGTIRPGDAVERVVAHPDAVTIAEANRIYYARDNAADLARLLAVDALSLAWREDLAELFAKLSA